MKKLFLMIAMCTFASFSIAQNTVNFKIDSEGEFHVPNSEKDYYVFTFSGKSAAQLYTIALKAANRVFNGTDDVVKKVPNQMLTITSSFENIKKRPWGDIKRKIFYVFDIDFKAGKIRVSAPRIPKIYNANSSTGDDYTEHPFSYIQIQNVETMNTWFIPMNNAINKMLSTMSNKSDDNW